MNKALGNRRNLVERVQREVERSLVQAPLPHEVSDRAKTVYSIYRKMRENHLSFAQVSDIFGFRVVVATLPT